MALGISIDFHPGPDGHWRQLYIVDVFGHCPECGYEAVERMYRDVPFHPLTMARMRSLGVDAWRGFRADCDQCSATLSEADARRHVLHWGFADGAGLVQAFGDDEGRVRWLLAPHRYFDVQANLERAPVDDISVVVRDELIASDVLETFGRHLNPKERIRELVRTSGGADVVEALAPGLVLHVGAARPSSSEDEALVRLDTEERLVSPLPGRASEWLSDVLGGAPLEGSGVYLVAGTEAVAEALDRHVERFPIDTETVRDGARYEVRAEGTPDDPLVFDLLAIAREAAETGAAPGDIARLELDRALLVHTAWSDELRDSGAPPQEPVD